MQLDSFNRHIRLFDQCSPFLNFVLDEFLKIFGRDQNRFPKHPT
jgi:hypothetical protein